MAYPPLISIVAGLLAAVLVPAIVYLSTLPLIAKSLRDAFDAVLGEEQSLRGLLQRGRQIAEGTYRNEITQVENLYRQQQEQAEQTHRPGHKAGATKGGASKARAKPGQNQQ